MTKQSLDLSNTPDEQKPQRIADYILSVGLARRDEGIARMVARGAPREAIAAFKRAATREARRHADVIAHNLLRLLNDEMTLDEAFALAETDLGSTDIH